MFGRVTNSTKPYFVAHLRRVSKKPNPLFMPRRMKAGWVRKWSISTADGFTDDAESLACEKEVTLLNRKAFVEAFAETLAPTFKEL